MHWNVILPTASLSLFFCNGSCFQCDRGNDKKKDIWGWYTTRQLFLSLASALVQKDKDVTTPMGNKRLRKINWEEAAAACQRSKHIHWFRYRSKVCFRCIGETLVLYFVWFFICLSLFEKLATLHAPICFLSAQRLSQLTYMNYT